MKTSLMSGAATMPFAHLLGLGRKPRAAKAEEAPERDDEDEARAEDGDDDEDDNKSDGRKSRKSKKGKAEDDESDDDPNAEDGDEDDNKSDGRKGKSKKGKAEDDDEDEACAEEEDDDEDVASAARAGRRAERARCRRIFQAKAAGVRPDMAAQLAFGTDLTSAEAIALLNVAAGGGQASEAQAPSRLHQRMSRIQVPALGSDDRDDDITPANAPAAKAKAIIGALNKARGHKA
ncbi:hypothetical protein [Phenylobacterium sp.]|uniref:hypothetical protein n=1 Tax=Phenylobacterium sp. TaxID=1871053 RepID=UPI0035B2092E